MQVTKGGSSLRYVGSPYQTSLSEAGQDKFLYCVRRAEVEEVEVEDGMGAAVAGDVEERGVLSSGGEGCARGGDNEIGSSRLPPAPVLLRWKEVERWTVDIGSKIIKVTREYLRK